MHMSYDLSWQGQYIAGDISFFNASENQCKLGKTKT